MSIVKYDYNGFEIQFEEMNGQLMANATAMCAAFGKKPHDWIRLESTTKYWEAIAKRGNHALDNLIQTRQGGDSPGTWIHEKLILKLAQWLDMDFQIWCDEKIAELLRTGKVELSKPVLPQSFAEALRLAADLQEAVEKQAKELAEAAPKVEFFEKVGATDNAISFAEAAKALNTGQNRLFKLLREKKILMHNNQPYQTHASWFNVIVQTHQRPNGQSYTTFKTLIKPNGLQQISKFL